MSTLAPGKPTLWLGPRRKILLYECPLGMREKADAATSPLKTYPAWGTMRAWGTGPQAEESDWLNQPFDIERISLEVEG